MREAGTNKNETKAGLFAAEANRKAEGALIDLEDPSLATYANAAMELAVLGNETSEPQSRDSFMQMLEAA